MRILKADHREVEKLLTRLADSDEGSEREEMVQELAMKLTAHMETEESMVYPTVKTSVGEEDEEEAEIEHRLAREGLQTVQQMMEQPGFGAAVEMLKGGIMHHVGGRDPDPSGAEGRHEPRRVGGDGRCDRRSQGSC